MKKLAKKTTCYFCKYIIINTQKCRYVTYKNTKKPICRYCRASKYKPLKGKRRPKYNLVLKYVYYCPMIGSERIFCPTFPKLVKLASLYPFI